MTRYVPILKAKRGELDALHHSAPFVSGKVYPILEIVPKDGNEVSTFTADAVRRLPAGASIGVDTTYPAQPTAGPSPLRAIADKLKAAGISVAPVIRTTSSRAHLADARYVQSLHSAGIVLRLGDDDTDPSPVAAPDLATILSAVGIATPDLDVILDFRAIATPKDVSRAGLALSSVSPWALGLGARSVTVASGAFPDSISNQPFGTNTPLRRFDADFWTGHARGFDFGDYAVNHPKIAPPAPRGPSPNLRYTMDHDWQIWREKPNPPTHPGNQSFFVVCGKVVHHPGWPGATFCWADQEIERCSRSRGGPGGATQWRAYGTNHHIETVVNRLATLGVP